MKLVFTIIQERDRGRVAEALSEKGFFFTKIASTGGFLREGNVTMLLGVEDDRLDEALEIIKENSKAREQLVSLPIDPTALGGAMSQPPVTVTVGGAVAFVINVESFERW